MRSPGMNRDQIRAGAVPGPGLVAVGAVLLVLAAGCGQTGPGAGNTRPAPGKSSVPPRATPGIERVPADWVLRALSPDRRTATILVAVGGCAVFSNATVDRTPLGPRVTAYVTRLAPGAAFVCPANVGIRPFEVDLGAPLPADEKIVGECEGETRPGAVPNACDNLRSLTALGAPSPVEMPRPGTPGPGTGAPVLPGPVPVGGTGGGTPRPPVGPG